MERVLAILRLLVIVTARSLAIALTSVILLLTAVYLIVYSHFDGTAELPADCAVVFGAAVYGQNLPGPAITRRVAAAADLYRRGQVKTLIFSGGKGRGVRESEAEVMRSFAIELGVSADDIIIEDKSHSTWENIANVRNLTSQCSNVVGVSDQYHLARIELLSWRQGWGELETVPAQDRPPAASEKRSVIREVLALIYYASYMDVLFPDVQTESSSSYEFHLTRCDGLLMNLCVQLPGVRCLCDRTDALVPAE